MHNPILNGQTQHPFINELNKCDAVQHSVVEMPQNFVDSTDIEPKFDDFMNNKLKFNKTMEVAITVKTEIEKYYNLR
jgi:hypothetical protein